MKGSGLGFMVLPHMNASTSPLKKLHFMKVASKKLTKSVSSVSMVLQKDCTAYYKKTAWVIASLTDSP